MNHLTSWTVLREVGPLRPPRDSDVLGQVEHARLQLVAVEADHA